jgi:hypothetical protein
MKRAITAHSNDITELKNEQRKIKNEIEHCRRKGWLSAIFPLQIENAMIELRIKTIKDEDNR